MALCWSIFPHHDASRRFAIRVTTTSRSDRKHFCFPYRHKHALTHSFALHRIESLDSVFLKRKSDSFSLSLRHPLSYFPIFDLRVSHIPSSSSKTTIRFATRTSSHIIPWCLRQRISHKFTLIPSYQLCISIHALILRDRKQYNCLR